MLQHHSKENQPELTHKSAGTASRIVAAKQKRLIASLARDSVCVRNGANTLQGHRKLWQHKQHLCFYLVLGINISVMTILPLLGLQLKCLLRPTKHQQQNVQKPLEILARHTGFVFGR